MTVGEHATYRSVLANREFAAILFSQALSILGDQLARIALAVLVFRETHSAFAASATFAVAYLTYLVGGPVLSALSDRYTRRTVMVLSDLGRACAVTALATAHLPVVGVFALLVVLSAFAPAFDSARGATLPDILPGEAYVRGNALCNLVFQAAMIGGFVAGGALLATAGTEQVLLLDAGTFLVSAGALLGLIRARDASARPERTNLLRDAAEGVRLVAADLTLRKLLGFALLGAVAVAGPESLAVPVAASLGGGTLAAGLLTASIPAGFVVASFAVLRFPPARRIELLPSLTVISVLPLLATPLAGSVGVTVVLWTVSGFGSSLQLVASAAYVAAAPEHARGRAYGLASTSLMASQGLAQLAAGGVSTAFGAHHGPGISVAVLGGLTLLLLPVVSGRVRIAALQPQGNPDLVR
ncbi:MAG: MFS transporter [Mycobacteriales bacterium]